MSPKPIPVPSFLDTCEYLGAFSGKKRWRSRDGSRLYTWDSLHGEIEVFNKRGKHLGALDAVSRIAKKDAGSMSDFIQKCLIGDALLEEIDDYIDDWHQGESAMSLHEFLGMTRNEYYLWVEDASSLPHIVNARIRGIELTESAERQGAISIAARSDRLSEISDRLIGWLKDEGLWE